MVKYSLASKSGIKLALLSYNSPEEVFKKSRIQVDA